MIPRPTCQSCFHFVPHEGDRGSCRAELPKLSPRVLITFLDRDPPKLVDARAKTSSAAYYPSMWANEPCCALHTDYAVYLAARSEVGALVDASLERVKADADDDPFG